MTNSREKGKRGEREAAKYLASLGYPAQRTQQYNGLGSGDIILEGIPDLHIEVKYGYPPDGFHVGSQLFRNAIQQAETDSKGAPWIILWRQRRRTEWRATFWVMNMYCTVAGDDCIRCLIAYLCRLVPVPDSQEGRQWSPVV